MSNINNLVLAETNNQLKTKLEKNVSALPKGFNSLRFSQNALTLLKTLDLTKMQGKEFDIVTCLMQGAYLGLDFSQKDCYMIPYGGKFQFMTSYLGAKKLCLKYAARPIQNIDAKLVKEGDSYEVEIKDNKSFINFKPKKFNNEKIIGAFAFVEYKDGTIQFEEMSIEEIESTRKNFSKQANGKAWKDSYGEMCKKTVIHRLCKHIQLDFENVEQVEAWNNSGDMDVKKDFESTKEDVQAEVEEVISEPAEEMSFTDADFKEV